MSVITNRIPHTVNRRLRAAWQYWNVGADPHHDRPRNSATARTRPWVQTPEDARADELRAVINPNTGGRWVPEGHYVKLSTLSADEPHAFETAEDNGKYWEVMMSDTPDELNDHADPILNAHGRVLIHGLGLGCVLNCVAHKQSVTHIDVVEINEDVVGLILPFFAHLRSEVREKINIYTESCVDKKWPKGTRWNYVWHDIWAKISADNLTDEGDPENGISYERLHRMFANRCDRQQSWAFGMARWQRRVDAEVDSLIAQWVFAWNNLADEEARLEMMIEATASPIGSIEAWKQALTTKLPTGEYLMGSIYETYLERAKSEMSVSEARIFLSENARREAQRRIRKP